MLKTKPSNYITKVITDNTDLNTNYNVIQVDISTNKTITLPLVNNAIDGFWITVKRIDNSNAILTINPTSPNTIGGLTTMSLTCNNEVTFTAESSSESWLFLYGNSVTTVTRADLDDTPSDLLNGLAINTNAEFSNGIGLYYSNGSSWVSAASSSNVSTSGMIEGNGSGGDPIKLVPGTTNGEIIQWNGVSYSQVKGIFNTTYVLADNGSDITGEIGNKNKPFATIDAAIASFDSPSTLNVLNVGPGAYTVNSNILIPNIVYYFEPGAVITCTTMPFLMLTAFVNPVYIMGYANFVCNNCGLLKSYVGSNAINLQCNTITINTGAASAFNVIHLVNDNVDNVINFINATNNHSNATLFKIVCNKNFITFVQIYDAVASAVRSCFDIASSDGITQTSTFINGNSIYWNGYNIITTAANTTTHFLVFTCVTMQHTIDDSTVSYTIKLDGPTNIRANNILYSTQPGNTIDFLYINSVGNTIYFNVLRIGKIRNSGSGTSGTITINATDWLTSNIDVRVLDITGDNAINVYATVSNVVGAIRFESSSTSATRCAINAAIYSISQSIIISSLDTIKYSSTNTVGMFTLNARVFLSSITRPPNTFVNQSGGNLTLNIENFNTSTTSVITPTTAFFTITSGTLNITGNVITVGGIIGLISETAIVNYNVNSTSSTGAVSNMFALTGASARLNLYGKAYTAVTNGNSIVSITTNGTLRVFGGIMVTAGATSTITANTPLSAYFYGDLYLNNSMNNITAIGGTPLVSATYT